MASAGGIGASEGDVKVEGDNVGAMGAPVTRPRLIIDGAVDGELDGTGPKLGPAGELDGDCIPLHDFFPGLTRRDSLDSLVDFFPGLTRRDSLLGLPFPRQKPGGHAASFVEPLSSVERNVGT
jgi:hypothetical protein